MCDKCVALDREIKSFRRLEKMADDPFALALIAETIADIEAEKASLHPNKK